MSDALTPIIHRVAHELIQIEGVIAVVLGGSRGRNAADASSDTDIGIYYDGMNPPSIDALRSLGARLDDRHSRDVVTNFGDWGPWINGGGWLTIEGHAFDWLYRDYHLVEQVIDECRAGKPKIFYQAGHPQGFWTSIYMGEVHLCQSLIDPHGKLAQLKALTSPYPPALKQVLIQGNLWEAGFALETSRKSIKRGDILHVSGGFFRSAICLVQVLFALNERYCLNEKGALSQVETFPLHPPNFISTVTSVLECLGSTTGPLTDNLERMFEMVEEVNVLVNTQSFG